MDWRVKGIIQKTLSVTPGGVAVNDWLQKTVGTNRNFDGQLDSKVEDWAIFLTHTDRLSVPVQGLRIMEVGTGWFPTLPVCYSLAGVARCITYDLNRHLNAGLTLRMLAGLERHLDKIATSGGIPAEQVRAKYSRLRQARHPEELFEWAGIEYRAPADASQSGLPDASVDIVFSNSVFEHVPPGPIQAILNESRRVLVPGGLSIHSVNCGDHYAYFDKSITFINYLTFSDDAWKFWDNELLYQNRLRPADFLDMAKQAGLDVALAFHKPRPECLAALPSLQIAPRFQHYAAEQLCATSVDFVGRKTA